MAIATFELSLTYLRDLRYKQIVDHMQTKTCSTLLENYLNYNVESYIKASKMYDQMVWATIAEILGTASLLKCDIGIYCKYGTSYK